MIRKILLVLLVALIAIQFFHSKKNKTTDPQPNYIGNTFSIPADVKSILAKACNDCHSNNTRYPWYSNVQPFDWWMAGHIKKGKKGLNFDEYTNRSLRYQFKKMEDIAEQIKEKEMPLKPYLWIHRNAKLSADERNKIIDWAASVQADLRSKYPIDSLIRKGPAKPQPGTP